MALRHAHGQDGRARVPAVWRTILAAHRDAAAVRVMALPGASQDEVLTAMTEAGAQVVPLH